jgi:hypothetical protein
MSGIISVQGFQDLSEALFIQHNRLSKEVQNKGSYWKYEMYQIKDKDLTMCVGMERVVFSPYEEMNNIITITTRPSNNELEEKISELFKTQISFHSILINDKRIR